jgi:hypothetical protein
MKAREPDRVGAGALRPERGDCCERGGCLMRTDGSHSGDCPDLGAPYDLGDCCAPGDCCHPAVCPQQPLVHALADGELSSGEAQRVRRHLVCCAQCRAELAFLHALASAVAQGVLAAYPRAIGRPS